MTVSLSQPAPFRAVSARACMRYHDVRRRWFVLLLLLFLLFAAGVFTLGRWAHGDLYYMQMGGKAAGVIAGLWLAVFLLPMRHWVWIEDDPDFQRLKANAVLLDAALNEALQKGYSSLSKDLQAVANYAGMRYGYKGNRCADVRTFDDIQKFLLERSRSDDPEGLYCRSLRQKLSFCY